MTKFVVTVFGAESTGKTTLSLDLSRSIGSPWFPEFARPYLECEPDHEVTTERMHKIWYGQRDIQWAARELDLIWAIQDTDLWSTVGYWNFWDGNTPELLKSEAEDKKSDLYLITQSNIPFTPDKLRYGGTERESTDRYWINLCERNGLNYHVIQASDRKHRIEEGLDRLLAMV